MPGDVAALLEVRTYELLPGTAHTFDEMVRTRSLPMLKRYGIVVVAQGRSVDDDDHYYLIRAFSSAKQREQQLEAFYGSAEWRQNHRDAFMAMIRGYHTVAIELTRDLREALISASARIAQ